MSPFLQDVSKKKGTISLSLACALVVALLLIFFDNYQLYKFLRLIVTLFAVLVVVAERNDGLSHSNIFFVLLAAFFNPLFGSGFEDYLWTAIYLFFVLGLCVVYSNSRPKVKPTEEKQERESEAAPDDMDSFDDFAQESHE